MSELSPEARALIDATLDCDEPSAADRQRIASRLGEQLGISALATTSAVAATNSLGSAAANGLSEAPLGVLSTVKATLSAGITKLMAATLLVGAISTAAIWSYATNEAPKQAKAPVAPPRESSPIVAPTLVEHAPAVASGSATQAVAAPEAKLRASEPAAARDRPRKLPKVEVAPAAASAPPTEAGSLQRELALVGDAQRALREGQATVASARARDYLQAFPSGTLREEAHAIDAMARCALDEAPADAIGEFEARAPNSVLATRVRAACAERAR